MLMLLSGQRPKDIDAIDAEDKLAILTLMRAGAVGWAAAHQHTYLLAALIDKLTGSVVSFAGGRHRRMDGFASMFPLVHSMGIGRTPEEEQVERVKGLSEYARRFAPGGSSEADDVVSAAREESMDLEYFGG